MSDLISRSRLIEEIKENQWGWFSREMMLLMLENQPTVEAKEVVHGEWIKTDKGVFQNANTWRVERQFSYECSLCGYHTGNQGKYFNFCPNCGADMRTSAE
jgi:rubrerythrin